jgi:hypothetical protein
MSDESLDSMRPEPNPCDDSQRARQNYVCRAQEKFDCDSTSRICAVTDAANATRLAARIVAHPGCALAIVEASLRALATLTSNA